MMDISLSSLSLRAPAKLNLYLHVLGRRADGYHDIESLVVFTDLADKVSLGAADTLSLTVTGEFADDAGAGPGNLVLKAARALQQRTGCALGAEIVLTKNIPVGAGLGGGSADAAAALKGLNRLWQLGLSAPDLHIIAVTLGADVAMCLDPKPAMVRGIGEIIEPLPYALPAMVGLLIHPRATLLTKDVYAAFTPPREKTDPKKDAGASIIDFWQQLALTTNHLQRAAIIVNPMVAEVLLVLETVQPSPQLVRMTGSGACCFALYHTMDNAARAAAILRHDYPQWWIYASAIAA